VVVTTNKDVTAIPVDISKRMLTCHIDAAIPENKSVAGQVARKITREIGTALYRAYLLRMLPKVQSMRAAIDEGQPGFPDLLTASSETLREIFEESLGAAPEWARKFVQRQVRWRMKPSKARVSSAFCSGARLALRTPRAGSPTTSLQAKTGARPKPHR
jgi:hypothetical protein